MRWPGHVARMGEEREVCRVLVGKLEGKRPLGRPSCRWVDNIRMDLQEVGSGYIDWIGLAQDRDRWRMLVSAVMFPHQDPLHNPLLTHTHHMPSPSHYSRFYYPHNIE